MPQGTPRINKTSSRRQVVLRVLLLFVRSISSTRTSIIIRTTARKSKQKLPAFSTLVGQFRKDPIVAEGESAKKRSRLEPASWYDIRTGNREAALELRVGSKGLLEKKDWAAKNIAVVCDALKIRAKKGANYVHDEWKFEVTAKDLNAMTEMRMTKGTSSEKVKRGRISSAQTLLQCIFVHQVTLLYNAANAKKGKSREEKFIANASKTRKSLEAEQKADLDELEADKTKKIADIEVTEARVRTEQPINAKTLVADYARQKLQIGADYLAKCKAVGTHWNGVWNERTVFHRARQNALKKKRETKERVTAITSVGFIGPVAPPPPAGALVDCPESKEQW